MEKYRNLIRQYLLLHGHSLDFEVVGINEKMSNFMVSLANLESFEYKRLKLVRRKEVLRCGKEFYETHFKVHDIYYATDRMVHKLDNCEVESVAELMEKFNEIGIRMSPYNLPVFFNQKKETNGFLGMLQVDVDDDEFLKQMRIYFKRICLKRWPTILTASSYIHELAHSQLESIKGGNIDYNNSELISIFLEFVSLLDNSSLFNYNLYKRIDYLILEFDRLIAYYYEHERGVTLYDAFLTSKYIVSILKAFKLLYLYIMGSENRKKEIMCLIQEVFDEKRTLEEMLDKMEINVDNSLDINIVKSLRR